MSLQLLPALDLIDGCCVRLQQGDFERETRYQVPPAEQAGLYYSQGARHLHLVDLDGARAKKPVNLPVVRELAGIGLEIQCGGGIRTQQDIDTLFSAGASRVVIGSLAVSDSQTVLTWLQQYGAERITLALDVRIDNEGVPHPATAAWLETSEASLWDVLDKYTGTGLRHLLCTDIGRDGELSGPSVALYREILERYPELQLQASGGISSLADLLQLKDTGAAWAISGKALLENRFTVSEAIQCLQDA